jgi:tRNA U34 2-thiouridine synthase MnmA/TrmU
MNRKALSLLSGGLDSILATKLMLEQGIEVEAANFLTTFCTCTRQGCRHAATQAAETLKVPLKVFNISEEYLEIVKNPRHGYGSNMNPCLDCRIFIFKKAKEYMKECGASFIVTGEVLGERPMSQRRDAIMLIEREAGLKGLVLRPLSAKHFDPTLAEKEGLVDRDKLLDISGRSRKPQMALAEGFGINDYPCPAGGCLLTDPGFAARMRDLLKYGPLDLASVKLLKLGRHFRLSENAKLIVGRDAKENDLIQSQAGDGDICLRIKDGPGPFSVVRGPSDEGVLNLAARIAAYHTKFRDERAVSVACRRLPDRQETVLNVEPATLAEVDKVRVETLFGKEKRVVFDTA